LPSTISPSTQSPTSRSPTTLSPSTQSPTTRSSSTQSPTALAPTTLQPTLMRFISVNQDPVLIDQSGLYMLARSTSNQILTLARKSANPRSFHDIPAGRSYDGMDWEPVFPLLSLFECNLSGCSVFLNISEGNYIVMPQSDSSRTDEEIVSDFLIQSTFGSTRASIAQFPAGNSFKNRVKSFISQQIQIPSTLHRAYYRSKANSNQRSYTPSNLGPIFGPCEIGSRWERTVIDFSDASELSSNNVMLEIRNGAYLYFNGQYRGESQQFIQSLPTSSNRQYYVCNTVFNGLSVPLPLRLSLFPNSCPNVYEAPLIEFNTLLPNASSIVHENAVFVPLEPSVGNSFILNSTYSTCNFAPASNLYAKDSFGKWYRYNPRLKLLENTIEKPNRIPQGKAHPNPLWSANVAKNFLNENNCIVSPAEGSIQYRSVQFTLNDLVLQKFYALSGLYVYRVSGLIPKRGPCFSLRARFMRQIQTNCASPVSSPYLSALIQSSDIASQPIVLDVITNADSSCSSLSPGVQIQIGATCWTHVHDDLFSVFDFSSFANSHSGGSAKIRYFAENSLTAIIYPQNHHLTIRWEDSRNQLRYIGIYGTTVNFLNLPSEIQTFEVARYLNALNSSFGIKLYSEICGSRGESSNNPRKRISIWFLFGCI
jgi:cullin-associated NEDD8-dissociated protein 1